MRLKKHAYYVNLAPAKFLYKYYTVKNIVKYILCKDRKDAAWPAVLAMASWCLRASLYPCFRRLLVTWSCSNQSFICKGGPKHVPVSEGEERTEGGRKANNVGQTNFPKNPFPQLQSQCQRKSQRYGIYNLTVDSSESFSCCRVILQMCTLQWPSLHVFSESAQCLRHKWMNVRISALLIYCL